MRKIVLAALLSLVVLALAPDLTGSKAEAQWRRGGYYSSYYTPYYSGYTPYYSGYYTPS